MCSYSTFNKQWMDFLMLSLLFHHAVVVVFHMLSLPSLKKSSGFGFLYVVTAHMLSLLSQKSMDAALLVLHCIFSKQWMDFYILSLLFHFTVDMIFHVLSLHSFIEQWM